MTASEIALVKVVPHSFEDACVRVRQAVDAAKWTILGGYDFAETLTSKGFPQTERIKSYDACNARHANEMLGRQKLVSIFMPCTIIVFTEDGKTKVATTRPSAVMPSLFDNANDETLAYIRSIETDLQAIFDSI